MKIKGRRGNTYRKNAGNERVKEMAKSNESDFIRERRRRIVNEKSEKEKTKKVGKGVKEMEENNKEEEKKLLKEGIRRKERMKEGKRKRWRMLKEKGRERERGGGLRGLKNKKKIV